MNENEQKKFHEVVADFDTAILVTTGGKVGLHGRPMAVAKLEPEGRAYFATSLDSPKVLELSANPQAVATFQQNKRFATLTGSVTISQDRTLIDTLWSDDWGVWFPGGKTDPNLCILILDGTMGEYWDRAGLEAVSYAFVRVAAALKGEDEVIPVEDHAHVRFQGAKR
jgi:general stress protein 26